MDFFFGTYVLCEFSLTADIDNHVDREYVYAHIHMYICTCVSRLVVNKFWCFSQLVFIIIFSQVGGGVEKYGRNEKRKKRRKDRFMNQTSGHRALLDIAEDFFMTVVLFICEPVSDGA